MDFGYGVRKLEQILFDRDEIFRVSSLICGQEHY